MIYKICKPVSLVALAVTAFLSPAWAQTWVAQGPGPTTEGQVQLPGGTFKNPVSGAVGSIAIHPTNPNIVYVGAINGGVWKTSNATAANPVWTPLTDQALPTTSIASLAMSPLNPNVLFAGTGSLSSFGNEGSDGVGLGKSTDGGATWSLLAASTFAGKRIVAVVPTTLGGGNVVLAATLREKTGLYRSTDGGATFTRISGSNGLPDGGVSSIAADPGNPSRFYAGVPSDALASGGQAGVYVSNDGGVNWSPANGAIPASIVTNSLRILLAVSAAAPNPVYADFISSDPAAGIARGNQSGMFRSPTQGASWINLGLPPPIYQSGQGEIHGAVIAHPTNPNAVFVAGDSAPNTGPPGCTDFVMNGYRNDSSNNAGTWSPIMCDGASGTGPHADSRAFAFDSGGDLLHVNDGGVARLKFPDASPGVRTWVSMDNNIQPTEIHSVAYDSVSNIVFAGTQDTGVPIQTATASVVWKDLLTGDGDTVAVDADQTAHPGTSVRYTGNNSLGNFNRTVWDSANNFSTFDLIALKIAGGTTVYDDPDKQFYTPFVLNKITPARMLLGTSSVYESFDRGDNVTNVLPVAVTGTRISALAYGGKLGGVAKPDVFYAAAGTKLYYRTTVGGAIAISTPSGSELRSVAMDPENHKRVFVIDVDNRVLVSSNEGTSWSNITANLPALTDKLRAIEVYGTDAAGRTTRVLVAAQGGVYQLRRPGAAGTAWTLLGTGMPRALVYDVHYDYTDQVIVAGLLGRGAWTINNPFSVVVATPSAARSRASAQAAGSFSPLLLPHQRPVTVPPVKKK